MRISRDKVEEMMMDGFERDQLLTLITNAIKSESYVDPFPILEYLGTFYPNRLKRRLEAIDAQGDESN